MSTNIFATPTVITPEQRKRRDIYRAVGRYLCDQLEWTEEQVHAWIEHMITYWAEFDANWPPREEQGGMKRRWWDRAEDEVRRQQALLDEWHRERKERRDEAFDALWEHVADILGEKPEFYTFSKALDSRVDAWHTKSRDAVTLWFTLNAEDFRRPRCACGAAPARVDGAGVGWCKRCDEATDRIALDLGPVDDLPY